MDKHYKGIEGRDIKWLDDQGDYYIRHVSAMTSEGLHSKADIAAELAYRDWRIDNADTALAAAEARIAELEKALGPFALTGKMIPTDFSDFEVMTIYASAQHLRRAAALLKEKE